MNLLPKPQSIKITDGFLKSKKLNIVNKCTDNRIEKHLSGFEKDNEGAMLTISHKDTSSEGYTLKITEDSVEIKGESVAGAFYGLQTLKQLFEADSVPCLVISDCPDMEHRGFYHDITRGKVPKLSTLKELADTLAYCKMNSLQLYMEHTFPFKELGNLPYELGCLTPDEIKELDDYCYDRFIELIPSIPTFGHVYELLEREEYKDLQCAEDYKGDKIFWLQRMRHHTIDPLNPKSIGIITSMIDQIYPLFRTDKFNICGDETFDLTNGKYKDMDTGKLYIDFINKIISHLKEKGKKIMMWGDILLQSPETITEIPEDTIFLNWDYAAEPDEDKIKTFASLNRTQYICPGTTTWSRFCESISIAGKNIAGAMDYAYKYGVKGMINTNWGDYGTPCTLELSMYGIFLGGAKAWNKSTDIDEEFHNSLTALVYKNDKAIEYIGLLDEAHTIRYEFAFNCLVHTYSDYVHGRKINPAPPSEEQILASREICHKIIADLSGEVWERDVFRQEIIIGAEAVAVMGELLAKAAGYGIEPTVSVPLWLEKFKASWLERNKPSELGKLVEMYEFMDKM